MELTVLDWCLVAAYFVVIAAVGAYFTRRAGSSLEEFFVSGRSLPWWVAGTSMVATTFAADTPLAVVSLTARNGLAGNWFWWAFAVGGMVTVFVFAKLWRRSNVITDVELIKLRYSGEPARWLRYLRALYVALIVNPIIVGWVVGAMLTVLQHTVLFESEEQVNEQLPVAWGIVLGMLLMVGIYSTLSGMWGVAITDVIQFIVAMLGCIWLASVAVSQIGGMQSLEQRVLENFGEGGSGAFAFIPSFTSQNTWMPMHVFLIMCGMQWWATWYPGAEPGGGGYVVQRMASAQDERHSVLATLWFQIAHYCLRPWPWLLVAFAALAMYPELRSLEDPGIGFPRVMRELSPPGLRGLMLVTFFAAFMSTISTQMNWGASYLMRDFIQPVFLSNAGERQLARYSRVTSVGVLILGLMVAYWMKSSGMSVESAWKMLAALGAGTGLIYMLRWFWWRISAWSEIAGMVASLVFYLMVHSQWFASNFIGEGKLFAAALREEESMAIVALLTIATWLLVTFLTPPTERATLESFYRQIHPSRFGWRKIAQNLPDVVPDHDLGLRIAGAILATGIVYCMLPGLGQLLFGHYSMAAIYIGLAILFAWLVKIVVQRMFSTSTS
ncbi:MAG: Na+:solute symporter [Planctomycetales bacterium]|nr:Na+:solute symporter [Planctomycetales bacterium]